MRIDDLKLSEIAEIERLGGRSIAALGEEETPRGRMLQAIAAVVKRREDPKYKFEDAGDLTMEEALALITDPDEDDDADKSDGSEE